MANKLLDINAHAEELRRHNGGQIEPTSATRRAFEEAYPIFRQQALEAPTPSVGSMLARIETHVIKAARISAVCSSHSSIEIDDLARGLALGEYLTVTATKAAESQVGNDMRRVEHKLLQILEAQPGTFVKTRVIQQRLSGYADADRFHKAIRALIKLDRIEPFPFGEVERPKMLKVPS